MTQNGQFRNTNDGTLDDDNNNKDLLQQIASSFRSGVEVKDRKYRLMTFKQCFIGSDAVDFMVSNGIASNREEAIKLGQSLMTELSLFEHVTRDHPFADDHLFYHFIDRGDVSINPVTKEKFQWSDYLDPSSSTSNNTGGMSLQPKLPVPNMEYVSPNDVHVASHIWPLDDHNLRLLDHVHPTGWKDPTSQNKYDLVVIGGGMRNLLLNSFHA